MQTNNLEQSAKHIHFIDYLKALSIIMVIFTHYNWSDKTGLFFTLIIAMAVPIFMLISGFNFSMSYDKKTNSTLKEMYAPAFILPRLYRFLFPYTIIYIAEIILHIVMQKDFFSLSDFFYYFLCGGLGPGSYYVPLLALMLFCFPLIFLCIRHFSYWGVFLIGLINLAYECYVRYGHMKRELYRLLFFRYLLFVALGCYMYFSKDKKRYPLPFGILIPMFLIGLSFSISVYQFDYRPPIFRYWTKTAMPLALYIFPIIVVLMHFFKGKKIPGFPGTVLAKIGQASYHIFLIQMLYYRLFAVMLFPSAPVPVVVAANIIITVILGYGYFLIESWFSKKILKK